MCGRLSWWETEDDDTTTNTDENGKPVADSK
jgi:hypothetical protein